MDDAVDAHFGPCADPGAVEHRRAGSQEGVVCDLAAGQIGARSDENIVADPHRVAADPADHRGVHDDAVGTDRDRAAFGGQHRAETDRAIGADRDVPAHHGVGSNSAGCMDIGLLAVVAVQHGHPLSMDWLPRNPINPPR